MYRTLCVAVLLSTFVLAQGSKPTSTSAPANSFSSPLIVAKGKLVNHTTTVPMTTIFTPTQTGLYRLSVYMTTAIHNASSTQDWEYNLSWSDDAGAESVVYLLLSPGASAPPNAWGSNAWANYWPGQVVTFEAIPGIPVSYSVTQGVPDGSAYSLYWAVERLE